MAGRYNMETSSEGEASSPNFSNSSDWSEADDSISIYREEIDEVTEVALDLTTDSRMPIPFANQPQTAPNLTSASAASLSAQGPTQSQSQSHFGANSPYIQYLVEKFSNYSVVTMYHVEFEINQILFKADMGTYQNAE
ncbi:GL25821 [Drosophila persimilis]|uniref:GL25821 n=1 Tax=Drosophila persimilis TaxID=7234 RepID=B4GJR0_DROPE|nr:uncharacterized protein LOC6593919 [Drosophila persimilis]EDW36876.1 GL25821 [Drosophila persimilis]